MEKMLRDLLIAGALQTMEQVHRVSHRGIMVPREDTRKVESCRRFLTACEAPTEPIPDFLFISLETGWIDPTLGVIS